MTPLAGKRIVVTRAREQAPALSEKLAALGAVPILFPTIDIAPLDDYTVLDQAIAALAEFRWVIFTSVNGVAAFWKRLTASGKDESALTGVKVAAIGPATGLALEKHGVHPEFIPEEHVAERILDGLGDLRGLWVLLPRAEIARKDLVEELILRGVIVQEIAAYRTLPATPDPNGLAELSRGVDAITFTSSSTVRNFSALLSGGPQHITAAAIRALGGGIEEPGAPARAIIACIGPITALTARECDLPVDIVAKEYTMGGLVAVLSDYFTAHLPRTQVPGEFAEIAE